MPVEILMPDTASEKGKGTKLFRLITENFPVQSGNYENSNTRFFCLITFSCTAAISSEISNLEHVLL